MYLYLREVQGFLLAVSGHSLSQSVGLCDFGGELSHCSA